MEYCQPLPSFPRRLVHRRHIDPFRSECEALYAITELVRGIRPWPWWRRIMVRDRIFELSLRCNARLQGIPAAEREAKRAVWLACAPDWLGDWLHHRWLRQGQAKRTH